MKQILQHLKTGKMEVAERVGHNARTLTARVYSHEYVSREARPLIQEFANLEARSE